MTRAAAGLGLAGNLSTTTHQTATSTGTANIQTITPPNDAAACLITVETTAARITFDGESPGAGAAPGLVFPTALAPVFVPLGKGATIKFASNAAGNSIVQVLFLS